jgi:hypothetical protein
VSTRFSLHTQYLHFEKLLTILHPKNKMWGFGKNILKSTKIVFTKYNFLHFKILTRCVHQSWWKYYELWVSLKSLELDLFNSFINIHKRWRFCMWWTYFDQNNTRHRIWKMRNIFQEWGSLSDFLYEILGEKWKWYNKQ